MNLGGNITNIATLYLASAAGACNATGNTIPGLVIQDGNTKTSDTLTAGGSNQVLTGGGAGKLTMVGAANTMFKDSASVFNGDLIQSVTFGDAIDITGLAFTGSGTGAGQTSLGFTPAGGNTTLSVSVGGVQKTAIALAGSFGSANFSAGSDGSGGTSILYHA